MRKCHFKIIWLYFFQNYTITCADFGSVSKRQQAIWRYSLLAHMCVNQPQFHCFFLRSVIQIRRFFFDMATLTTQRLLERNGIMRWHQNMSKHSALVIRWPGNPPVNDQSIPLTGSDVFCCCKPDHGVEQIIPLSMIYDTLTRMGRPNGNDTYSSICTLTY